jgi:hypothetical protein
VTLWDSKQRGSASLPLSAVSVGVDSNFVGGRPDVIKLIKQVYASWGAEVVFITSNYQGNQEMMEGCKEAGIPAFVRPFIVPVGQLSPYHVGHRGHCGISELGHPEEFMFALMAPSDMRLPY